MWLFLAIVGIASLVVWAATQPWRKARRFQSSALANDDECCWMCRGSALSRVGDRAYRCDTCNNLQGPGAAKLRDATRRSALSKLPHAERLAQARRIIEEAKLEYLAVEGELRNVLELSIHDLHDADGDGGRDKLSRFAVALGAVANLEQKLVDSAILLADEAQLQRLSVDVGNVNAVLDALDIHLFWPGGSASGFAEHRTHQDIERALGHLPELHALLQRLEEQLARAE